MKQWEANGPSLVNIVENKVYKVDFPIDTPMNASSVWFKLVTSNMNEKIQGDLL